jgi:predicted acetyltransferase
MATFHLAKARRLEIPVIRKMMELYYHDLSEYTGDDLNIHGTFEEWYLDQYWTEDRHFPYLLKIGGKFAGFALVGCGELPGTYFAIAQFFVMRKYRRNRIGCKMAYTLFDKHRGQWEIMYLPNNIPARRFWRSTLTGYVGKTWQEIPASSRRRRATLRFNNNVSAAKTSLQRTT